jgi:hypothetical protein
MLENSDSSSVMSETLWGTISGKRVVTCIELRGGMLGIVNSRAVGRLIGHM